MKISAVKKKTMFNDLLTPNFIIVNYMYYIKHPKKQISNLVKLRGPFKLICGSNIPPQFSSYLNNPENLKPVILQLRSALLGQDKNVC